MRVGFQKMPTDLVLAAMVTLAVLVLVLLGIAGPVRYTVALVLVFFVPGYAVLAALFPRDREVDWIRRIALSAGLSIATVALLGLLLDALPAGLNLASITGALVVFSLGALGLAGYRRARVPEGSRLALWIETGRPGWRGLPRGDRVLAIAVVIALVSGFAVLAVGLSSPAAPDRYTELYLLDSAGGVVAYPVSLNVSQQGFVNVAVHNVEGAAENYSVVVMLIGLSSVYNTTTGTNQTVEVNATFVDSFFLDVASGATGEQPYPFSIPLAGQYLLEFRLYVGAPQGSPYRFVDLHVTVS